MIYRAKKDRMFVVLASSFAMVVSGLFFAPMVLVPSFYGIKSTTILIGAWIVLLAGIIWCASTIQYEFRKNMLHAKCGPFTKKIPYRSITNIEMCSFSLSDLALGRCTFASRDGVVVTHRNGAAILKVSPQEKHLFTAELQKQMRKAKTI
ncbi:hypothetical protein CN918_26680 [Priestia megaterium]|nr:hypothetical protein CN918_26680 [Priestia megaterium]